MSSENDITQELFETIEGYLMGTLSETELAGFESQLKVDTYLQQKVEEVKILLMDVESAVLVERMNDFHQDLDTSETHPSETTTHNRRTWIYGLGLAASITLFAMLYFGPFTNQTSESLFNTYFEPDPGLPTTMGTTSDFDFYDAMVDYKQGKYDTAITKWERLPNGTKGDTLTYFLGVAHLANTNESKAIDYLVPLSQKSNPAFAKETHYYLGLAYLKQDDVTNAKRELEASGTPGALKILAALNE